MAGGPKPKEKKKNPTKKKSNAGRKTRYKAEYDKQAYKLCLMGYTDKQLADFWEVCEATINNWKNDHPKFLESIKAGKELADAEVVETLFNKATGKCTITETRVFEGDSDGGSDEESKGNTQTIIKQVAPSDTSMIFWLKNRQPDKWRDKQELEVPQLERNVLAIPVAAGLDDWQAAMDQHQSGKNA